MDLTPQQRRAATLAALLGNALEWFDFAVYGYVAPPSAMPFSRPRIRACRHWLPSACLRWVT